MQSASPELSTDKLKPSPASFYLLSFTWGLPTSLAGMVVATGMVLTGHRPRKYGLCCSFELGQGWGGCSMGPFFFTQKGASPRLKNHEHGHALQNCKYGPFMPFVVSAPSTCRYWYRRAVEKRKKLPPYDSVWFEADATKRGTEYVKNLEKL